MKFDSLNKKLVSRVKYSKDAPVFSDKSYNAGHIDYYVAHPLGKKVFAVGTWEK